MNFMKKLILGIGFLFFCLMAEAQLNIPKLPALKGAATSVLKNFIAPPPIGDAAKTSDGVVSKLISSLATGGDKKAVLTSAIKDFLVKKQGIIGLAKNDPSSYLSKFTPLQQGLFGKLKGILGAATFTKFLGLKPAGGDPANILSNLFF